MNGKLKETEKFIFYVSYGILTDKCKSYVFLKRNTELRLRMNGNVTLEARQHCQTPACVCYNHWPMCETPSKTQTSQQKIYKKTRPFVCLFVS